jgi:hypothetical protein
MRTIHIIRKACRALAVNPGVSAVLCEANGSTFLPDSGRKRQIRGYADPCVMVPFRSAVSMATPHRHCGP